MKRVLGSVAGTQTKRQEKLKKFTERPFQLKYGLFDSFEIGCCLFRGDSELSTVANLIERGIACLFAVQCRQSPLRKSEAIPPPSFSDFCFSSWFCYFCKILECMRRQEEFMFRPFLPRCDVTQPKDMRLVLRHGFSGQSYTT